MSAPLGNPAQQEPVSVGAPVLGLLALGGFLLLACGRGEPPPDDSALDRAIPWTFTEVNRLGGADTGLASFTSASESMVGSDAAGRLYVLDQEQKRVAVFDSLGRPLRSQGRKGGGPGEIEMPTSLDVSPSGVASVYDVAAGGLVVFGPNGKPRPTHRHFGAWDKVALRGDSVLYTEQPFVRDSTVLEVRVATAKDTAVLIRTAAPAAPAEFGCAGFSGRSPVFSPVPRWAYGGGKLYVASQAAYEIAVHAGGRIERQIRRPIEPRRATVADAVRGLGGMIVFSPRGRCDITPQRMAEVQGMAKYLPVIDRLAAGPRGELWVERFTFRDEPPRTDVFDSAGTYLGTVTGWGAPLAFLTEELLAFAVRDTVTDLWQVAIARVRR